MKPKQKKLIKRYNLHENDYYNLPRKGLVMSYSGILKLMERSRIAREKSEAKEDLTKQDIELDLNQRAKDLKEVTR